MAYEHAHNIGPLCYSYIYSSWQIVLRWYGWGYYRHWSILNLSWYQYGIMPFGIYTHGTWRQRPLLQFRTFEGGGYALWYLHSWYMEATTTSTIQDFWRGGGGGGDEKAHSLNSAFAHSCFYRNICSIHSLTFTCNKCLRGYVALTLVELTTLKTTTEEIDERRKTTQKPHSMFY